jgi:hypothetical protein
LFVYHSAFGTNFFRYSNTAFLSDLKFGSLPNVYKGQSAIFLFFCKCEAYSTHTTIFAIKTDTTLQLGQRVSNTAHIYFDFNPAVVTNTVTAEVRTVSTQEFDNEAIAFEITPNSGRDVFRIQLSKELLEPVKVHIYDASGRLVISEAYDMLHNGTVLPRWSGTSGAYLVQLVTQSGSATRKLRVE